MFTFVHVSYIMCHMSHVACHMSHVTCHMSHVRKKKKNGQCGGAYWTRVCYQRGLPRLVFGAFLTHIVLLTWCRVLWQLWLVPGTAALPEGMTGEAGLWHCTTARYSAALPESQAGKRDEAGPGKASRPLKAARPYFTQSLSLSG